MPSPTPTPTSFAAVAVVQKLVFAVKYWAPVWIPCILLWQFATKGLQPALSEARRLEEIGPGVDARHAEAKSAFEQVQAEAKAWQDPVYRERRRRLRFQDPNPEQLAQNYAEDAYFDPFSELEAEWSDLDEPIDDGGDWEEHAASPAEFLESYNSADGTEPAGEPFLASQTTWETTESDLQPTDPNTMTLSSPSWTVSEPSWSPSPSFGTDPQGTPDSPPLGD